ncbi:MAG: hypothetical protein GY755_00455 [Chloroflexi bacterium]|nr:hypothetical protein [Chloroflexota bacterium]
MSKKRRKVFLLVSLLSFLIGGSVIYSYYLRMTKMEKNLTTYLQSPECAKNSTCRQIIDTTIQESGNSYEERSYLPRRASVPANTRVIHWFDILLAESSNQKVEIITDHTMQIMTSSLVENIGEYLLPNEYFLLKASGLEAIAEVNVKVEIWSGQITLLYWNEDMDDYLLIVDSVDHNFKSGKFILLTSEHPAILLKLAQEKFFNAITDSLILSFVVLFVLRKLPKQLQWL